MDKLRGPLPSPTLYREIEGEGIVSEVINAVVQVRRYILKNDQVISHFVRK